MNPTIQSSAFNKAVAPAIRQAFSDPRQTNLVAFSADPTIAERIEELAAKSNEGDLTDAERDEYHGYIRANKFIATLYRQFRRALNLPPGSGE